MNKTRLMPFILTACVVTPVHAERLAALSPTADSVEMYKVTREGPTKYIGTIEVTESPYGIVFQPNLSGLDPGLHGFHVHELPTCEPNVKDQEHAIIPAGGAGDHYDPESVDRHGGPWAVGHAGDLPNLVVDAQGNATHPVLAPRLTWEFLKTRSLIIHADRDQYIPELPSGGSGARIACGVLFSEKLDETTEGASTPGNRTRD